MPDPCIIDTDCIALSLDGSGNLQADITLDPDPDNALTCRTDGLFGDICPISTDDCNGLIKGTDNLLWSQLISRDTAVSSFPEVTRATAFGEGNVIVQSGSQTITNNGCDTALIFRNFAYGTSQITTLTDTTRVELETESNIDGGAFTDHGFAVLENITGLAGLEHAWWPTPAPEVGFSTLAAGASQTVAFNRRAEVTSAGSCSVNYRTTFIFTMVLSISGL